MHADFDIDWERLDRWVRQEGTPGELEELRRWVESDADLRAMADAMRTIGRPAGVDAHSWDVAGRWQGVQRELQRMDRPLRIAGMDSGERDAASSGKRPRRRSNWQIAAAAAVVLAAGIGLWRLSAVRQAMDAVALAHAPMREIVTRRGERVVLDLPDGSRVVIAPESRLRIPATYRAYDGPRDVFLDGGDAYFSVEHNAARPFRVYAASGVAEDLGTEFVVTAYPKRNEIQVVVVSGEVTLSGAKAREAGRRPLLALGPGELGRLDSAGNASVSNVEAAAYVSWVDGILTFDGTPLDETIATLGRWYDLDIRLADSTLGARRVTAPVIRNQSGRQVLESLAWSLGLRVEQRGTTIVLSDDDP